MLFQPARANRYLWDTWLLLHEGLYHLFHLQKVAGEINSTAIAHAVSEDLVAWKPLEPALLPGPTGAWDSGPLRTGLTVRHSDRFYLFYGSAVGGVDRLGVATSTDLMHWERHPGNPVAVPDPRWYESDAETCVLGNVAWRDPCILPDGSGYVAYLCARRRFGPTGGRGTIATLRSPDLLRWEVGPPLDVPAAFQQMEVPDVFDLDGRWFLLHSTSHLMGSRFPTSDPGLTAGTFVLWAKQREGPYTRPPRDVLVGSPAERSTAYVCRTLATPMGRIAYYHNVYPRSATTTGPRGSFALPKGLATDDRGLKLVYLPLLEPYAGARLLPPIVAASRPTRRELPGEWALYDTGVEGRVVVGSSSLTLAAEATDLLLTARVTVEAGHTAGVAIDLDSSGRGLGALLDAAAQRIAVVELSVRDAGFAWRTLAQRQAPLRVGVPAALRLIAVNDVLDVFIEDELMLSTTVEGRRGGALGFVADDAHVRVADLNAWALTLPDRQLAN